MYPAGSREGRQAPGSMAGDRLGSSGAEAGAEPHSCRRRGVHQTTGSMGGLFPSQDTMKNLSTRENPSKRQCPSLCLWAGLAQVDSAGAEATGEKRVPRAGEHPAAGSLLRMLAGNGRCNSKAEEILENQLNCCLKVFGKTL